MTSDLPRDAARAATERPPGPTALGALVFAAGFLTAAGLVAGEAAGSPALALAPAFLAGVAYVAWRVPLRWSASALLFLLLTLEVNTDAGGMWHTPLVVLGDALRDNLEHTLHVPGLKLSGLDVAVLFLMARWLHRRATGSAKDEPGQVQTAAVLRGTVLLYLACVGFAFANGFASGGRLEPWLVRRLLHLPLLFAFFAAAFRGPRDHVLLGRIVVGAACVKAVFAIAIQRIAIAETGGKLAHATNHGDSILFALAILIVVVDVIQGSRAGRLARAAPVLCLLLLGALENGRRIVWVELAMGLAAVYLLAPPAAWKRAIARVALVSVPLALLFVTVGWSSQSRLFAPVRTLRSVTDGTTDHSTLWRDVENWNLAVSLRERPILGIGLGKEYAEHMPNADISIFYPDFRLWPHNSVLGLLLFAGLLAFTGMSSLFAVAVFLAVRSLRRARSPVDRTAALCVVGATIVCLDQAYGDLGAAFTQFNVLMALALAVAGKLAVSTGAWPLQRRPRNARLD